MGNVLDMTNILMRKYSEGKIFVTREISGRFTDYEYKIL